MNIYPILCQIYETSVTIQFHITGCGGFYPHISNILWLIDLKYSTVLHKTKLDQFVPITPIIKSIYEIKII